MKHTLESVMAEIEKLQAVADEIRQRERQVIIDRVREAMATYKITLKDLTAKTPKVEALPPAAKTTRGQAMSSRVKYRGPEGQTWSGFGRQPKWVQVYVSVKRNKLADLLADEFKEPEQKAAQA